MMTQNHQRILFAIFAAWLGTAAAFQPLSSVANSAAARSSSITIAQSQTAAESESAWFSSGTSITKESNNELDSSKKPSLEQLKAQILQLGAALDRGQPYNPTSGSYYETSMAAAQQRIQALVDDYPKPALTLSDMEGEWELVLTTVAHGIFRSSPFFLAIQEAYERYAEEKGKPAN